MLLRRVVEHVRDQNWLAVAIDFIIVVVGVFIGIQVSNWNESRADLARSDAYLQRLIADLQVDIETIENRLAFWDTVSAYGNQALAHAASDAPPEGSDWPTLLAYFQASQLAEFVSKDTTFTELKSAGELYLIGDTNVRNNVAEYYRLSTNPVLLERPRYRESVRGMIPLPVQLYIWEHCYNAESQPGVQELVDCAEPDNVDASTIVQQIADDALVIRELTYWMSTMRIGEIISRSTLAFATDLQRQLYALTDPKT